MPESNGPHFASGTESETIHDAGVALYEAMQRIVDVQPSYVGVDGPERVACVARLCQQALASAVLEKLPLNGEAQTYVLISSVGRLVGQVIVGQPDRAPQIMTMLANEARVGAIDLANVLTPKGRA